MYTCVYVCACTCVHVQVYMPLCAVCHCALACALADRLGRTHLLKQLRKNGALRSEDVTVAVNNAGV